jgi:hypothetical protein
MTSKQLPGSIQAPDGSAYITLTDGAGNLVSISSGNAVSSVFSRTGAVTATTGDYSVSQISGAAPSASPTFTGTAIFPAMRVGSGVIIGSSTSDPGSGQIVTAMYTVTTLPSSVTGARAFVTDALAPTFLGLLTGGGTSKTPVFYNGAAWAVG